MRVAEQRRKFAAGQLPHVQRFGGDASDGTTVAALHRAWMHLRAHTPKNPDRAVVNEIARGERVARAAYDVAHQRVPPDTRTLIETHELGIRVADRLVAATV
jgi:uncharacterized protein (TIGR02284 family)